MDRRFNVVLDVLPERTWRCIGCQVPVMSKDEPQVTPCGGPRCGGWLPSEVIDAQFPTQSLIRDLIETTMVGGGWSRMMASSCEPHIRKTVDAVLRAEVENYSGHTIDYEHSRSSAVFTVFIYGQDPIMYRYAWADWTPTP